MGEGEERNLFSPQEGCVGSERTIKIGMEERMGMLESVFLISHFH